ncbi:RES domain-containing protein [Sphingomonas sp. PAMC 26605]|uniref:RES domain-containing protein n=1 Tax=Sphingomonas sp. PAMC 26605 TaxID=1112214 RepID=UPI00026CDE50|nr:RES domain-containing protein [Sphingomonas sp. PAMC 26605]
MTLFCPLCFSNKGLKRRLEEVRKEYDEGKCDRHPRRKGIPIEAVAAIVDEVFRNNYEFGEADPIFSNDPEEPEVWFERKGDRLIDVVEHLTGAEDEDIALAVTNQLIADDSYWPSDGEEPFYDDEFRYERTQHGDGGNERLWQRFCTAVVHERRFFNDDARDALRAIFKDIHLQRDTARVSPVYLIDPANTPTIIFRARIVSEEELRKIVADPVARMGAAPQRIGHANRMNPSGVTAFYGSFDLPTCLSELRPKVGDLVVAAQFTIRRPLCVLDTTRFIKPPQELNLFAQDHIRRLSQWRFMQTFMATIARPISPDDEHLDYVPTQAVAEYLNSEHLVWMGKEKRHIDAIIYTSAQRPAGKNIVFLGHAAITEPVDPPTAKRGVATAPSFDLSILTRPLLPASGLDMLPGSLWPVTVTQADFGHETEQLYASSSPNF